ncbi:NUDIX domain-containing protein [Bacillus sp. J14TS2]|uniref:NUDIX domain-containing protein n=1 Tax=Bacillus sp. J14TS2 TaxID=2807188 RepID=UPI001BB3DF0F|nr:NUDIX domain-containing protein [Bacillus sp. J14TS2]
MTRKSEGQTNTFLPGGHIEFGESAKDALKREINEALGIPCTVGRFLGVVEHKWELDQVVHCEINQVFEVHCSDLRLDTNPIAIEPHLEFFWWHGRNLDQQHLQPYPFRHLIANYLNGNRDIWWESTVKLNLDVLNRS